MYSVICIFLSCYAAHRHLHSFPTRRSSDLTAKSNVCTLLLSVGDPIPIWPLPMTLATGTPHVTERLVVPVRCTGDRKSTRLNSSHANISYAVFCLKKKNNII